MDWADEDAAKVYATLEGGPHVSDDVERVAAVLRMARRDGIVAGLEVAEKFMSVASGTDVAGTIAAAKLAARS